jgi:hypothetical protein
MQILRSISALLLRVSRGGEVLSERVLSGALAGVLALVAVHLSLISTSALLPPHERAAVERAIDLLHERGFETEAFVLRNTATFRKTDHWLNLLVEKENAFAATNFPFQIVTIYPDFYGRAEDDTERAMILLHEARHLMGMNEADAHLYVWQQRERLGWTQLSHGSTETYVTVEQQTREHVPELFTCEDRNWNDCTETLRASR